eukprot:TRINITY_DN18243_c0_g1_i1.p1 TRINITY_DN18243_c0_g1~~TRINITY_DN18243_c0_g1_i1.p1  ORF type:complete len:1929 (+),score=437.09 TRINITY_DN18243_c0_g1_i1:127-5913(+)
MRSRACGVVHALLAAAPVLAGACTVDADCSSHAAAVASVHGLCVCECEGYWTGAACDVCPEGLAAAAGCICSEEDNRTACVATPVEENATMTATDWSAAAYDCTCTCKNAWEGPACSECPPQYDGSECDTCAEGYVGYPVCEPCAAVAACHPYSTRAVASNADRTACACECNEGFGGATCEECAPGRVGYPFCVECSRDAHCAGHGNAVVVNGGCWCDCDAGWAGVSCTACEARYRGDDCTECAAGRTGYPRCQPCSVDLHCSGSQHAVAVVADAAADACICRCAGQWEGAACDVCPALYGGEGCDTCAEDLVGYPRCAPCHLEEVCGGRGLAVHRIPSDNASAPGDACYCTQCVGMWTGPRCDVCPAAHLYNTACDGCADGRVGYPNCTPCAVETHCNNRAARAFPIDNATCGCECVGQWTGAACDVCPELFGGGDCDACAAGLVGFPHCRFALPTPEPVPTPVPTLACSGVEHCSGHGRAVVRARWWDGVEVCECECYGFWVGDHCETCPDDRAEALANTSRCGADPAQPAFWTYVASPRRVVPLTEGFISHLAEALREAQLAAMPLWEDGQVLGPDVRGDAGMTRVIEDVFMRAVCVVPAHGFVSSDVGEVVERLDFRDAEVTSCINYSAIRMVGDRGVNGSTAFATTQYLHGLPGSTDVEWTVFLFEVKAAQWAGRDLVSAAVQAGVDAFFEEAYNWNGWAVPALPPSPRMVYRCADGAVWCDDRCHTAATYCSSRGELVASKSGRCLCDCAGSIAGERCDRLDPTRAAVSAAPFYFDEAASTHQQLRLVGVFNKDWGCYTGGVQCVLAPHPAATLRREHYWEGCAVDATAVVCRAASDDHARLNGTFEMHVHVRLPSGAAQVLPYGEGVPVILRTDASRPAVWAVASVNGVAVQCNSVAYPQVWMSAGRVEWAVVVADLAHTRNTSHLPDLLLEYQKQVYRGRRAPSLPGSGAAPAYHFNVLGRTAGVERVTLRSAAHPPGTSECTFLVKLDPAAPATLRAASSFATEAGAMGVYHAFDAFSNRAARVQCKTWVDECDGWDNATVDPTPYVADYENCRMLPATVKQVESTHGACTAQYQFADEDPPVAPRLERLYRVVTAIAADERHYIAVPPAPGCADGLLSIPGGTQCAACPHGLRCNGTGDTAVEEGWWRGAPGDAAVRCPFPERCLGSDEGADARCNPPYSGTACTTCAPTARVVYAGICMECPPRHVSLLWLGGGCVFYILVFAALYFAAASTSPLPVAAALLCNTLYTYPPLLLVRGRAQHAVVDAVARWTWHSAIGVGIPFPAQCVFEKDAFGSGMWFAAARAGVGSLVFVVVLATACVGASFNRRAWRRRQGKSKAAARARADSFHSIGVPDEGAPRPSVPHPILRRSSVANTRVDAPDDASAASHADAAAVQTFLAEVYDLGIFAYAGADGDGSLRVYSGLVGVSMGLAHLLLPPLGWVFADRLSQCMEFQGRQVRVTAPDEACSEGATIGSIAALAVLVCAAAACTFKTRESVTYWTHHTAGWWQGLVVIRAVVLPVAVARGSLALALCVLAASLLLLVTLRPHRTEALYCLEGAGVLATMILYGSVGMDSLVVGFVPLVYIGAFALAVAVLTCGAAIQQRRGSKRASLGPRVSIATGATGARRASCRSPRLSLSYAARGVGADGDGPGNVEAAPPRGAYSTPGEGEAYATPPFTPKNVTLTIEAEAGAEEDPRAATLPQELVAAPPAPAIPAGARTPAGAGDTDPPIPAPPVVVTPGRLGMLSGRIGVNLETPPGSPRRPPSPPAEVAGVPSPAPQDRPAARAVGDYTFPPFYLCEYGYQGAQLGPPLLPLLAHGISLSDIAELAHRDSHAIGFVVEPNMEQACCVYSYTPAPKDRDDGRVWALYVWAPEPQHRPQEEDTPFTAMLRHAANVRLATAEKRERMVNPLSVPRP